MPSSLPSSNWLQLQKVCLSFPSLCLFYPYLGLRCNSWLNQKISGGKKPHKPYKNRKHNDEDDASEPGKRRRDGSPTPSATPSHSSSSHSRDEPTTPGSPVIDASADTSLESLRAMVEGRRFWLTVVPHLPFSLLLCSHSSFSHSPIPAFPLLSLPPLSLPNGSPPLPRPGKHLSLDCEMVGIGPLGSESSLARVSIVNIFGFVILDEFVRQRERVVDYRTEWSGVRAGDMLRGTLFLRSISSILTPPFNPGLIVVIAKPFEEVQKLVADLLKDRILVGHAVLAWKGKVVKTRRVALRNLVKQEVGVGIQGGEHSSVTDARATMAVYRLHKKEWDKLIGPSHSHSHSSSSALKRKASSTSIASTSDTEGGPQAKRVKGSSSDTVSASTTATTATTVAKGKQTKKEKKGAVPGPEGRKGVSSGLSTRFRSRDIQYYGRVSIHTHYAGTTPRGGGGMTREGGIDGGGSKRQDETEEEENDENNDDGDKDGGETHDEGGRDNAMKREGREARTIIPPNKRIPVPINNRAVNVLLRLLHRDVHVSVEA
ncbi:hypothetical protein NMY22_g11712 [Coprinellus aureogranulatus]|nr:hypothetical protein NMY22_g11712 [Coprinellus aureogranulatus]